MKYKNILFVSITLIFVVLILLNISLQDVMLSLHSIGWKVITLCLFLHFGVYACRSIAMKVFFRKEVPFDYLLNSHLIHNFYLNIIPASIGEFSLPILLNKFVSKSRSFSVLLFTRFVNILIILVLFAISISIIFRGSASVSLNYTEITMGLIALIIIAGIGYIFFRSSLSRKGIIGKIRVKVVTLIQHLKSVVQNDLNFSRLLMIIIVTFIYLLLLALFYHVILLRLNLSLNLMELFFIMTIQVAILVLPIKSFGGFGTTEGSWMLGMMALGIEKKVALETGFTIHIIALFSAFIFFIIGLLGKKFLDHKYEKSLQHNS